MSFILAGVAHHKFSTMISIAYPQTTLKRFESFPTEASEAGWCTLERSVEQIPIEADYDMY